MVFPILKNKHREEALFSPKDFIKYQNIPKHILNSLPDKYIITYQSDALKHFKRKYNPKKIKIYSLLTILKYKNIGFIKMTGIGSPNAATVFEELIALGGKEFINIGTAGGLRTEGVYLCDKALRDEGTSYHYIPHGVYAYPDKTLTEKFGKFIKNKDIKFHMGSTWTIDAPYRETKTEINKYSKEGIATVEMEASALFTVAKLRKVKIASIFVVSDLLRKKWSPKFRKFNVKNAQRKLIDAAIEFFIKQK